MKSIKIFFFETSPGTHTIVGAANLEEARNTIGERSAYCILLGWVPADELCIITGNFVPSILLPVAVEEKPGPALGFVELQMSNTL